MAISKEELVDKLKRAYEMEEIMADILIGLCQFEEGSDNLPDEVRRKIHQTMLVIQKQTWKHRDIDAELLRQIAQEVHDEY